MFAVRDLCMFNVVCACVCVCMFLVQMCVRVQGMLVCVSACVHVYVSESV